MLVLFILPVCISAYLGGAGPGLLASVLSCLLALYFLIPPLASITAEKPLDTLQLGILFLDGVLISVLSEFLHRARRRARALSGLQVQLDHLAEHVPGVLYTFRLHPDGRANFPYISPALEELFGLRGADMQQDAAPLFARVPEPDRTELKRSIQDSAHSLAPWHQEFRYQHETRGERWMEGRSTPRRRPDGGTEWYGFAADITQKKQAERALLASELRWKFALEGAGDGVWDWDMVANTTFFSTQWKTMLGYGEGEIGPTQESWESLIHPDDRSRVQLAVRAHLGGETAVYECEHRLRRKDGTYVWVLGRGLVVDRSPEGQPRRVVGTQTDISQRKRAEQALRESEARFRSYIENAPVAVMVVNRQGHYVDCNPAAVRLLGYARDELFTMSIASLVAVEDQPGARAHFQQVVESGLAQGEFRLLHKGGGQRWVAVHASRISDDRFMAYCLDVTARKEAEALVRQQSAALQAAANAIVITDQAGTIEWVNPAFCAVSGYTAQEAVGKNPRALIKSGHQDEEFYRVLWQTISAGQVWRGEIINRRKDGKEYTEEMTITPIRDERGSITHYVAIKQDITERKSLEAQLLRTQRLESVGRLASGIAHDLNNILAPVLLAPIILREVIKDPSVLSIVDSVEASAQRGADIVRQLLTFGRGVEAKRVPLSLRSLIADMMKIMTETFPRNIETRQAIPPQVLLVDGDPTQLHQLLMNLCVNARDAMPEGGTLSISITETTVDEARARIYAWAEPGPYVMLSVQDTGTGIAREHLDKIFDPFFTTKAPGEGTGLGLSTAIGIARNHRGFIEVQSALGRGTTFQVYLPQSKSVSTRPTTPPAEPLLKGHGQHVLLVDDEESVRHVLGQILRTSGYQPTLAVNGVEALAALHAGTVSYAAVITDLMMPVMDGWTLIKLLKEQHAPVKIIAISGHLPQPDWMEKIRTLTDGLLVKPCRAADLLKVLHELLPGPAR